jgi:inosine/xanthosine triphosphate pyrophosphatase family protein
MKQLAYVTGNAFKFRQADVTCKPFGVQLEQIKLDIPEIQAATGEQVARDKAAKAFAALQKPLVVSDDSWMIPGLNNFPGPYMKHMNDWFTVEDWLRLTSTLEDRSIILRQIVIHQDEHGQQLFSVDIPGILLREARGASPYPHASLVSLDGGKRSNAEYHEKGESAAANYHNPWHEFAQWYGKEETK